MANEFEGEGNPVSAQELAGSVADKLEELKADHDFYSDVAVGPSLTVKLYLSVEEREALQAVLDRETTSRPSYDGLRQLLSLSHTQAEALLGLLRRIKL